MSSIQCNLAGTPYRTRQDFRRQNPGRQPNFAGPNFTLLATMSLFTTGDGSHSFVSARYGAAYHSPVGAITESAHVFIDAGLRFQARRQREIDVLEAGFGSGLNAFMTWLEAERLDVQLRYLTVEAYPLALPEVLESNYPMVLGLPERSADFRQLHTTDWNTGHALSPHFHFEKRLAQLEEVVLPEAAFDLIYFDAFDPQVQPELWTAAIFTKLYSALRPGGILVTYCAQGQFRRTLKNVGFQVEKLKGTLGKWEMTRAGKI